MDGVDVTAPERRESERLLARHRGAIVDCDIHPGTPTTRMLLPYFEEYWREVVTMRGIEQFALNMTAWPYNAPANGRADWRPERGRPGSDLGLLQAQALDAFGLRAAICNVIHPAQAFHGEDIGAAFCHAINDWLAAEWLDRDPRLRGAILVPPQSPELAVEEIERLAPDRRFVQILLPGTAELPLGRRHYWPIYEACERHGLSVGVHAGTGYHHAPTPNGWPSHYVEDYVHFANIAETQVFSFLAEGVFTKFPELKVVFAEAGFMWVPVFIWRADKLWRGVRTEVPWVKEPPGEILRHNIRFTLQPVDEPPDPATLDRLFEHLGSDRLILFSTDYPHWQFDGSGALPAGLAADMARKILVENPLDAYPRLAEETVP